MCQYTLVALNNKSFDVLGRVRLQKSFFTEAPNASKVPDLVLPKPYVKPFIKFTFCFRYVIQGVVHSKPSVWELVYHKSHKTVGGKIKNGAQKDRNNSIIPRQFNSYLSRAEYVVELP